MRRRLVALLTLATAVSAAAQQPFVAPTGESILGTAEATSAVAPTRRFVVANRSSVPVVVYSLDLWDCKNVKQACASTPVSVVIPAGGKGVVGRVDAQEPRKRYTYEWSFQYRADTSDARVAALLREHGLLANPMGRAENLATQAPVDTSGRKSVFLDANNRPVATKESFRFRVARGSILASAKTPGATVLTTGACINPAELAEYERDTTIAFQPAQKPVLKSGGLTLPTLTPGQRDSLGTGIVTMRWVVDTTGSTIPGSVRVVDSPLPSLSVQMCGAVIGAYLSPGRGADGRAVRTWVEAPIRVVR